MLSFSSPGSPKISTGRLHAGRYQLILQLTSVLTILVTPKALGERRGTKGGQGEGKGLCAGAMHVLYA